MVVALDETAAVAVLVDDGQVHGVAVFELGIAGGHIGRGAAEIDPGVLLDAVFLGDQFGGGQFAEVGVGVESGPVGKRQFLGLDEEVNVFTGIVPQRLDVVVLQHVEHLQGRDTLPVGRQFPDVVAAVVCRDGIDPVTVVVNEVLGREIATVGRAEVDDPFGDLPGVKGVATVLGDLAVAPAQVGILEDLADPGGPARGEARESSVGNIVVRRAVNGDGGRGG